MKHRKVLLSKGTVGRPFTGAWIETGTGMKKKAGWCSRPFTGAWIETGCNGPVKVRARSPLHGGVD